MKKVEAILPCCKLDQLRPLLVRVGISGMTVTDVHGPAPHLKVEIVLEDGRLPALIQELIRATRTGQIGDGKIFVLPVEDAIRIRTRERGSDAL